jgi:hypothetical protein
MATLDDLWQLRWNAVNPDVPYAPDSGIGRFWREHPDLGSPLSGELPLETGGVAQAFANGIVRWTEPNGAELVSAE